MKLSVCLVPTLKCGRRMVKSRTSTDPTLAVTSSFMGIHLVPLSDASLVFILSVTAGYLHILLLSVKQEVFLNPSSLVLLKPSACDTIFPLFLLL